MTEGLIPVKYFVQIGNVSTIFYFQLGLRKKLNALKTDRGMCRLWYTFSEIPISLLYFFKEKCTISSPYNEKMLTKI